MNNFIQIDNNNIIYNVESNTIAHKSKTAFYIACVLGVFLVVLDVLLGIFGNLVLGLNSNLWLWSLLYALSSGTIELEIYTRNLEDGLKRSWKKNALKHAIAQNLMIEEYNKICTNSSTETNLENIDKTKTFSCNDENQLLKNYAIAYYNWQKAYDEDKNDMFSANTIAQHEEKLRNLEEEFIKKMMSAENQTELTQLFRNEYKAKNILCYITHVINLFAAFGAFFSTTFMVTNVLVAIGLCTWVAPISIIIASICAIIMYLQNYRTMMHIISDDLIKKFWTEAKNCFKKNTKNKICLILAFLLTIAISFLVTLAAAGTYWQAGIPGQVLLFKTSYLIVQILFIVPGIAFGLLFSLKNIAETFYTLGSIKLKYVIDELKKWYEQKIHGAWNLLSAQENYLIKHDKTKCAYLLVALVFVLHSIINIAFEMLRILALVAHCACEGLSTDNAFIISAPVAALTGTAVEFATDLHYTTDKKALDIHKRSYISDSENSFTAGQTKITPAEPPDKCHNIAFKALCLLLCPLLIIEFLLFFAVLGNKKKAWGKTITERFFTEKKQSHIAEYQSIQQNMQ